MRQALALARGLLALVLLLILVRLRQLLLELLLAGDLLDGAGVELLRRPHRLERLAELTARDEAIAVAHLLLRLEPELQRLVQIARFIKPGPLALEHLIGADHEGARVAACDRFQLCRVVGTLDRSL